MHSDKTLKNFVTLQLAQETSCFAVFVNGFSSGSKNSSVMGEVIYDVTTKMYVRIFIDGIVKSLYSLELF